MCFPECDVPGHRGLGHSPPPPDAAFLEHVSYDHEGFRIADLDLAPATGELARRYREVGA